MEMYFTPTSEGATDRELVLAALRRAGLDPLPEIEDESWVVAFPGSNLFITFQQREGHLSFATLDIPMAEQDQGHSAFCALEDVGWLAEEDVG